MKKDELEQIADIHDELKMIEQSMLHPKSRYVAAFYKDYSTGIGVPRVETGEDGGMNERILLELRYEQKKKSLQRKVEKAQKFIDSIEDAEMRTILQGYYIAGLSQEEIAARTHWSQSTVSRRLDEFWERENNERA